MENKEKIKMGMGDDYYVTREDGYKVVVYAVDKGNDNGDYPVHAAYYSELDKYWALERFSEYGKYDIYYVADARLDIITREEYESSKNKAENIITKWQKYTRTERIDCEVVGVRAGYGCVDWVVKVKMDNGSIREIELDDFRKEWEPL